MPRRETASLERCVAVARAVAWSEDEDVDVHHLLQCAMFTDDRSARSRLSLQALGMYHFVEPGADESFIAAAEGIPAVPKVMGITMEAKAVLDRIDYWTTRTGDETADTVHLLLACLEQSPDDLVDLGITARDVVREAMVIRYYVSPTDRQARARGPILSAARSDRPAAHRFDALHKDHGPRKAASIGRRSQLIGTAELASPVQLYLVRMHVWWLFVLGVVALAELAAIVAAMITVTPWAIGWLLASWPRAVSPTWVRFLLLVLTVVASVLLALPWWLAVGGCLVFLLITLDERFSLLEVRSDVADPGVTTRDLRRDGRINRRAANWYGAMKVTGKLTAQ